MSSNATFVAVYRGPSIGEAHLLAVTADPIVVTEVVLRILKESGNLPEDPALRSLAEGRREALIASLEDER